MQRVLIWLPSQCLFTCIKHVCMRIKHASCDLLHLFLQILSNFGVDVLEALSSTCTLFTRHSIGLMQLVSDFLVALLLITAHGGVLLCQVRLGCCCFACKSRDECAIEVHLVLCFVALNKKPLGCLIEREEY